MSMTPKCATVRTMKGIEALDAKLDRALAGIEGLKAEFAEANARLAAPSVPVPTPPIVRKDK
jgi:hypothetical protein